MKSNNKSSIHHMRSGSDGATTACGSNKSACRCATTANSNNSAGSSTSCCRLVSLLPHGSMLRLLQSLWLLLFSCHWLPTVFAYSQPHFLPNRTAIVQLYEWKFMDVAAECSDFLGPRGYAGVQLSPVTEHLVVSGQPWTARYQPISYDIHSGSGDESQFLQMTRTCNNAGVRVYVDVVLNHMAGAQSPSGDELFPLLGTGGSSANVTALDYPAVPYNSRDFHVPCTAFGTNAASDPYAFRQCPLNDSPDLDHSRANVRQRIVALLNKLVDLGVAGFRVTDAKRMWPQELQQIFAAVKNLNSAEFDLPKDARPFIYLDVDGEGPESISKLEYTTLGLVTENLYPKILYSILNGQRRLSNLINWGPAMGLLLHQQSVVYIDNLFEQSKQENGFLLYENRNKYILANAFMLAHPYGRVKLIMSSFYATESGGPPLENDDDGVVAIRSPDFDEHGQCVRESGWVCEHRWAPIVNMIAMANQLNDTQDGVVNLQSDGAEHLGFCRGHKAFVTMSNYYDRDSEMELHTCLETGFYCDVVSGGLSDDGKDCRGRRVFVNHDGVAKILIPYVGNETSGDEISVVAFYSGSKLISKSEDELEVNVGELDIGEEQTNIEIVGEERDEEGLNVDKETSKQQEEEQEEEEQEEEEEEETVTETEGVPAGDVEEVNEADKEVAEENIVEDVNAGEKVVEENVSEENMIVEGNEEEEMVKEVVIEDEEAGRISRGRTSRASEGH